MYSQVTSDGEVALIGEIVGYLATGYGKILQFGRGIDCGISDLIIFYACDSHVNLL